MKPISLALLALCLCLTGCEKKTEPKTNVGKSEPKTNIGKREPKTNIGKRDTVLWEFKTGDDVNSSPAIGPDGTVYVGSWDKKLYAIKTDSKGPAKSPWPMFGQNAQHTGRVMKK